MKALCGWGVRWFCLLYILNGYCPVCCRLPVNIFSWIYLYVGPKDNASFPLFHPVFLRAFPQANLPLRVYSAGNLIWNHMRTHILKIWLFKKYNNATICISSSSCYSKGPSQLQSFLWGQLRLWLRSYQRPTLPSAQHYFLLLLSPDADFSGPRTFIPHLLPSCFGGISRQCFLSFLASTYKS